MSYYLGFDCATKTFAFSISRIKNNFSDVAALRERYTVALELYERAKVMANMPANSLANMFANLPLLTRILEALTIAVAALDAETKVLIEIIDGSVVNLVPGRPDSEVSTVERIKALAQYVSKRIIPVLKTNSMTNVTIVIEFQMGHNARARAIAAALVALFADYNVIIVGPSLKNRVSTCREGMYGNFAQKYSNNYGANKAHAIYNFSMIETVFRTMIPPTKPVSLRGHIADSFMQVLGHLLYGASEKDASKMF